MKPLAFLILSATLLGTGFASAQAQETPAAPTGLPGGTPSPAIEPTSDPGSELPLPAADPASTLDTNAGPEAEAVATGAAAGPMTASQEGYLLKGAPLNDILQFLAKSAGKQYFHNSKLNGPEYQITGHLNDGNPLQQMEELAFMYGITLHTKGSTLYALTAAQLSQLPSVEFHYQLQYLRPTDIKQIQELIKPMLSPASGIVNFEPKTNTLIVIDSSHRVEQVRSFLRGIDKAKGQIIVETKILRVNSSASENVGINWSSSLGKDGTGISLARDLNSVFGLPSSTRSEIPLAEGTNLVLSPVQLTGVLSALAEGGLASQVSNPTLITEDNEQATISVIDRVPIITSTTTPGSGGTQPTVTEEVRYKIDTADKSIDTDPDQHREIGISLVVTPTLLPDGTVRMKMRPRSAQITGTVVGVGVDGSRGNSYPRVSESMIETLARVPNGYSLVVGGFYGETQSNDKTKIPLLGDVPMLNFFFKSKEASKEKTSLVFIVTPKSYDPTNGSSNNSASSMVRNGTTLGYDHNWIDENNPGPAHEANLQRGLRGLLPQEAPYYPKEGEASPLRITPSNAKKPGFSSFKR